MAWEMKGGQRWGRGGGWLELEERWLELGGRGLELGGGGGRLELGEGVG